MTDDFSLRIGFGDFDCTLIGMTSADAGTEAFSDAVADFFCQQFESMGGSARVVVNDQTREIEVAWSMNDGARDPQDMVLDLLRDGQLKRAVKLLWTLIRKTPADPDNYYNIGVAYNELGEFEKAKVYLQQAVKLAPAYVNALAALGFAQIKTNEVAAAAVTLRTAVSVDPGNVHALKNLGGCLMNLGQFDEAESILRKAVEVAPRDLQSAFGLGQVLEKLQREDEADAQYQKVIQFGGDHPVAQEAAKARTRFAEANLRKRGGSLRPDVLLYCQTALDQFATLPAEKVKAIGFEIAVLGQNGLNVNDPEKKYQLKELSGEFTALKLVTFMYVAFQQIAPGTDIGMDFSAEYQAAVSMQ